MTDEDHILQMQVKDLYAWVQHQVSAGTPAFELRVKLGLKALKHEVPVWVLVAVLVRFAQENEKIALERPNPPVLGPPIAY